MEVKIFTKILKNKRGFWPNTDQSTDAGLAPEINLWLATKPNIKITNITQTQSGGSWFPSTLVISIWYEG